MRIHTRQSLTLSSGQLQGVEVSIPHWARDTLARCRGTCSCFMLLTGTRERYLETLLKATLKQLILVQSFPRSMIQIVLQIETTPENDYVNTKLMQPQIVSCI
jgi:hypothetical protein